MSVVSVHASVRAAWWLGAGMELLWRLGRIGGEPPMTRFLAAQLGHSHYYNIAAAERDLGYRPLVSSADGMERLAAWGKDRIERLRAGR